MGQGKENTCPTSFFLLSSYSRSVTVNVILTFVYQSPPSFQAKPRVWDKEKKTPALPVSSYFQTYSCSVTNGVTFNARFSVTYFFSDIKSCAGKGEKKTGRKV